MSVPRHYTQPSFSNKSTEVSSRVGDNGYPAYGVRDRRQTPIFQQNKISTICKKIQSGNTQHAQRGLMTGYTAEIAWTDADTRGDLTILYFARAPLNHKGHKKNAFLVDCLSYLGNELLFKLFLCILREE